MIYVVDDDDSVRDAIGFLLKTEGLDYKSFSSAEEFQEKAKITHPCVVLLDIRMPGMNGMDLQKWINAQGFHVPVIMISGHGDITLAVEAMKNGAVDFFEKPFDEQSLLEKIREALSMDKERQEGVIDTSVLSKREVEVMNLLAEGKLNKVVASDLNISTRTVEAHRAKIMQKLGVRSLADIVKAAMQHKRNA